ncbi:hypothetical protein MMC18_008295, partial [Xylographa bjoerkii]|nr:hypothetical protein [Xylographa bjoerkii]
MSTVQPYSISVSDDELSQLSEKLSHAKFPDELDEAGWDYGTPLADVKKLATYWKDEFNWRNAETKLNQLPNYQCTVQAEGFDPLQIHFVHAKSEVENAIPLLFIHGWPGSFIEVSKLLPLLADGKTDGPAFHIVAPSLPNFGFSEGVKKRGFALAQYAEICHKLMETLDYPEYVTQGGDWGSMISRILAEQYPHACKANHLNMVPGVEPSLSHPILLAQYLLGLVPTHEQRGLERTQLWQKSGMGYFHQQSTKPQTIGYALADSPVALLAWIYEKLKDWTDDYPWTEDEVLTWVSIYWFSTAGPAASTRIYYEALHSAKFRADEPEKWVPSVKLGLAYFPKEIMLFPRSWTRSIGPVVYENENSSGGHFAAWEKPESIAGDLRVMFGRGGGAYGVVD